MAGACLSACGQEDGGDGERASVPEATAERATATPAEKKVTIRITSPQPDAEVDAETKVAGRATPGTTVLVSGGCAAAGCEAIARAGDDGDWEVDLRVAPPRAEIEASTVSAPVRDVVPVTVRAPERQRAPAPRPEVEPEVSPPPVPQATIPAPTGARVIVVGDSLAVGIKGLLGPLIPGGTVSFDARNGRTLAEGMALIDGAELTGQPTVLAISLFTNNDPSDLDALEAAVRDSVAAVGPMGCAVWATIVRPPLAGVSYAAANKRLRALNDELPRMRLVDWDGRVAAAPDLLAEDGIHATPLGYQARAALYAEAIRSC